MSVRAMGPRKPARAGRYTRGLWLQRTVTHHSPDGMVGCSPLMKRGYGNCQGSEEHTQMDVQRYEECQVLHGRVSYMGGIVSSPADLERNHSR